MVKHFKSALGSFFYSLKSKMFSKNLSVLFFSFFLSVFILNFTAVWSFNFAYTSQVRRVLTASLIRWSGFILFRLKNNTKYFLLHSVPEGTPRYLTWFLFLIEIVRNFIRPITLTVRLVANILAGHLLIILLSKLVFLAPPFIILYLFLNIMEIFVSLIQSYIFCTIVALYFRELD